MVREAVRRGLNRMAVQNAHLFDIDVNERTLTQRLATYLQDEFPDWNVDCEYNRDGTVPKRLQALKRRRKNVFPDIIVHRRGAAGPNLLVVEAKKSTDLNADNQALDYLKLSAYKEEFGYVSTAFVVFYTDKPIPAFTVEFRLPRSA